MYLPMLHQMVSYVSGLAEGGRIRSAIVADERKPEVVESEGLVHVVNPDPLESETARCTLKEFAERFGFPLPEPAPQDATQPGTRGMTDDRLRNDEIWPWLALTLVGLLLVENFLANRTAA
jgi:hypothetical protein